MAHAVPIQTHSPGLSLGASAGNMSLRAQNKGRSSMAHSCLQTPETQDSAYCSTTHSKQQQEGECVQKDPHPSLMRDHLMFHEGKEEVRFHHPRRRRSTLRRGGHHAAGNFKASFPPGLEEEMEETQVIPMEDTPV